MDELTTSNWIPRSTHEMSACSRQHIAEVQSHAKMLIDRYGSQVPTLSKSKLKIFSQHDKEKVLDFNTLMRQHGYKGIPATILKNHQEYSSLTPKLSPDRQYDSFALLKKELR
jgi:hypothetical protein